jgi:MFS transporter, OPA family, sugar phosphate sensor protein UhpC
VTVSVLDVFRPAPPVEEIQDPELVKRNYRYWRLRTFLAIWAGYAFFYFTRKSFTFVMPAMQELGMGKFEIGLLGSILYITYGASKFISGILGDKSNPRYFMSIGLILTGILNCFIGMSSAMWAFAIFWGLNGIFQGWGWPGCAKQLTHWYSQNERGRWWSLHHTAHNIGGALIPLIVSFCAFHYDWRIAMYVPGVMCIFAGFWLMNRLRDTPQSLGLPSIEKYRNDYSTGSKKEVSSLSTREILFDYILRNKYIWLIAASYFLVYVLRTALNDWSMLYLIEVKNYSHIDAGFCIFSFELGGFFGSLVAGWASDLLFKGRRSPVNILFTSAILVLIVAFKFLAVPWMLLDAIFMFLFGFFIFGPQMLMGLAAAELSHPKAAATTTGFIGYFAYLGAAVAGGPLGEITTRWGWDGYLWALGICAFLGTALLIPLWNVRSGPSVEPVREKSAG